jgi:hypothetical protein
MFDSGMRGKSKVTISEPAVRGNSRKRTMEAVMYKSVAIIAIFLLTAGTAFAANTISKKSGDYAVDFTTDKNPPVMGKNNVTIVVKDKGGATVTDAKVVVEYSMPAMSGMPPMNYKSAADLKSDKYAAVVEPSMAGAWNVAVKITRGGTTETVKFTMDVK